MGIYVVGVAAEDWFDDGEGGWAETASGLDEELGRRGLPPYRPGVGKAGFEEKLVPPMDGFVALCRVHLSSAETEMLCGWNVLVPVSLDEEVRLPVATGYTDSTVVAGAPQILALTQRLAAAVELPAETPEMCHNLELTMWFLEGAAGQLAAIRPGPWSEDLDTAFYVALYLRAAQHSLRHGCPMTYS